MTWGRCDEGFHTGMVVVSEQSQAEGVVLETVNKRVHTEGGVMSGQCCNHVHPAWEKDSKVEMIFCTRDKQSTVVEPL